MLVRWMKRPYRLLVVFALVVVIGSASAFAGVSLWGEYHYQAARRALDCHNVDEARRHLTICLDLWPNSGLTHLLAAQAWRRSGKFEAATRHLREARRLLPSSKEVAFESSLLAAQQTNKDAICKQLHVLVERGDPRKNLILEALAKGYLRFFRYQEAAACLKEWSESDPTNAMAFFMLAWTYDQLMGLKNENLELYARALELAPNSDVIRFSLALTLLNHNRADEAIQHWEILAQRQPDNPVVLLSLARCQCGLGLVEVAKTNLDRFLEQNPNSSIALLERGRLAMQSRQFESAEKDLRKAVELDPHNYGASFSLYKCLEHLGRDKEVEKQHQKVECLGAETVRLNTLVNQLIPAMPTNVQLKVEAGSLYLGMGKEREGLRLLYSALQLDPTYAPALAELKDYYQRIGDTRSASRLRDAIATGSPVGDLFPLD
jgi:tetratricopeptide (TPR) repeat protein